MFTRSKVRSLGIRSRSEEGGGNPNPPAGDPNKKAADDKDTIISNLNGAIKEGRTKIADLEKKLADRDAADAKAKADADAKALEEKGAYEEAKKKWETDKQELEKKIADLTPTSQKWLDHLKTSTDSLLAQVPKEKKDLATKLLDGKSAEEQLALLPDLIKDWTGKTSFGWAPGDKGGKDTPPSPGVKDAKNVVDALSIAMGTKK